MKRTIYLFLAALLLALPTHAQDIALTTLVIDPGHGGKDPGTVSRDGKFYEKTFTLDISRKLAEKIKAECPDVKVILTRDKDKTVALNDRAVIANKAGADLFMSIHINGIDRSGPSGFSVHVLGQSSIKDRDLFAYNMDICKRENSVILLEDDYSTTYQGYDPTDPESFIFLQLMQNSHLEQSLSFAQIISESLQGGPIIANRGVWQDPFLVLWKTAMPAVLVELGFISNSTDLTALRSEENRDKLAARLCTAFKRYKEAYDRSVALDVNTETAAPPVAEKAVAEEKPAAQPAASGNVPEVRYGVQIFAGSKLLDSNDKALMGYTPVVIPAGWMYKYIVAVSDDLEVAKNNLSTIRKKYPDAFVVKIVGQNVTLVK